MSRDVVGSGEGLGGLPEIGAEVLEPRLRPDSIRLVG